MVPTFPVSYSVNGQIGGGWGTIPDSSTTNEGSTSLSAFVNPATTVFMSDGGSQPANPPVGAGHTWPEEHTGWVLEPYGGNIGSGNRGGPMDRHLEMSNVGFVDGHVKAMRAEKWYSVSADTPWLKPAVGGS